MDTIIIRILQIRKLTQSKATCPVWQFEGVQLWFDLDILIPEPVLLTSIYCQLNKLYSFIHSLIDSVYTYLQST